MTIETELLGLRNDEGLIVPEDAVEWARANPQSDLHHSLEWDDERAAHQYRLWQVRKLIAIYVVSEEGHRATVSLKSDRSRGAGYRLVNDVMRNAEMRQQALNEALAELQRLQERYQYPQELARVFEEAEHVRVAQQPQRRQRRLPRELRA